MNPKTQPNNIFVYQATLEDFFNLWLATKVTRTYLPLGVWRLNGFPWKKIKKNGDKKNHPEFGWVYGATVQSQEHEERGRMRAKKPYAPSADEQAATGDDRVHRKPWESLNRMRKEARLSKLMSKMKKDEQLRKAETKKKQNKKGKARHLGCRKGGGASDVTEEQN